MDSRIHTLFKKYWGHPQLHTAQKKVIEAVLKGRDVLAILPTGAGKSLCFQLATLCKPGLALVICPLVALMQEQVARLQQKGIPAASLEASLPNTEVQWLLEQARNNRIKCLYLSPERLRQEIFLQEVTHLPINLLVVDEAHCVSTWGQDFRPAYGRIGAVRKHLARCPLLALTATAPNAVQQDIIHFLQMQDTFLIKRSLLHPSLSYSVFLTKQKIQKLTEILAAVPGPALIYVPTRHSCAEWSKHLQQAGLSAQGYHAGLPAQQKNRLAQQWMTNKTRILVTTNALSMGMDKADLSLVIHVYVPESLTAYYQETGRAGRRNQKAYAVLLYDDEDIKQAQQLAQLRIPNETFTRRVYQALGNYHKIAVGSGAYYTSNFDFDHFTHTYRLPRKETHYALQRLLCEEQIQLTESRYGPSKIRLLVGKTTLYKAEIAKPTLALLTQALLRQHGGRLYDELCNIDENKLAAQLDQSRKIVRKQLKMTEKMGLIQYLPPNDKPQITFLTPRTDASSLPLNTEAMRIRQTAILSAATAMHDYLTNIHTCRAQILLAYLGEKSSPCGRCDLCKPKITKHAIPT